MELSFLKFSSSNLPNEWIYLYNPDKFILINLVIDNFYTWFHKERKIEKAPNQIKVRIESVMQKFRK
jgi:hypothetical protein